MKKIPAIMGLMLLSASAHAEVGGNELILAGVGDCLKEAIGSGSVEDVGDAILLSCREAKARILFGFLATKVRAEVVQDKNGKFENRQFGNNACYHRIADTNGKASDDYRCDLILVTGGAVKE